MSTVKLTPRPINTAIPVEAECITPAAFAGLTEKEIAVLPVWQGNCQGYLGDFFAVMGSGDSEIMIDGDVPYVKWIGRGMDRGRIEVRGAAGIHTGSGMTGGELHVRGNAGGYLGAQLAGGVIVVDGDAGHQVGAGYPGSPRGMNGGIILVRGKAGHEAGLRMERGLLAIWGDVGDLAGFGMQAGTIICAGRLGDRAGAGMKRGAIVAWGGATLLPTLNYACTYTPPWLPLYLRRLEQLQVTVPAAWSTGLYRLYSGDAAVGGKGDLLLWASDPD